jgi:hypothetical protein
MNVSHAYGPPVDPVAAAALLRRALDLGVTHFDTAALYGFGANERLVGEALQGAGADVVIASKCGMFGRDGRRVIDARPQTLRANCEQTLRSLRREAIDLYYLHRWDKTVPIEESIGALAALVREGKIREIGLSEVSAGTLRRARAVHPIAAVQMEYSLWTRNAEIAVLAECRRGGTTAVAFSPVGRSFLTDAPKDPAAFADGDIRRGMPRFQAPHWERNQLLHRAFTAIARETGCTAAQLAIAWVLSRGEDVVAIPGTTRIDHLEENCAAGRLSLGPGTLARLDALFTPRAASGERYPPATQAEIDTEQYPGDQG